MTPRLLYRWERALVPIVEEARWVSGLVWTGTENRKYLSPVVFKPQNIQPTASEYTNYSILAQ